MAKNRHPTQAAIKMLGSFWEKRRIRNLPCGLIGEPRKHPENAGVPCKTSKTSRQACHLWAGRSCPGSLSESWIHCPSPCELFSQSRSCPAKQHPQAMKSCSHCVALVGRFPHSCMRSSERGQRRKDLEPAGCLSHVCVCVSQLQRNALQPATTVSKARMGPYKNP